MTQPARSEAAAPSETDFRLRGTEVSRVEAFSDVVFGFALTLLVVSLEVPHTFDQLLADMSGFVPFAISFAILAQVWWVHHNFFRRYGLQDGTTIVLNFILLFVVLFYVYPLKFLFSLHIRGGDRAQRRTPAERANPTLHCTQPGPVTDDHLWPWLRDCVSHFHSALRHALRKRDELELNRMEVYDTQTSIFENAMMAFVGVLCAAVAALLPAEQSRAGGLCLVPDRGRKVNHWRASRGRTSEAGAAAAAGPADYC